MRLLVNFRVYLLLALVALSAYLVFSPYVFRTSGVVVSSLDPVNKCSSVGQGAVINQVAGSIIGDSQDFEEKTLYVTANTYVPMVVNGGPAGCVAIRDGYLGVEVSDVSGSQLKLSGELGESFATKLKAEDVSKLGEILKTMRSRIEGLKLVGYDVSLEQDLIKITGLEKDISALTKPCKFSIEVVRKFGQTQNESFVELNGKRYEVEFSGMQFKLNSSWYHLDKSFYLDNIETRLQRESNTTIITKQIFANNSDVEVIGLQSINYVPQAGSFRLQLPLSVSPTASDRFGTIIKGMKSLFVGGISVLDADFVFKLDERIINEVPVLSEIARQNIATLAIVSFDNNLKNLENVGVELHLCLNSGPLDKGFERVSVESVEPSGRFFAEISVAVFLISALAVSFVLVQTRYKVYRYWYVLTGLVLAELFIVFGFVSVVQKFTFFLIDLATVNGFSVFGAVSVGQMLFGMEYILQKKDLSLSYRIKKFGRINWVVNLVVFAASIALLIFARGFGFVLMFGVVTGALITKPILFNTLTKMQL